LVVGKRLFRLPLPDDACQVVVGVSKPCQDKQLGSSLTAVSGGELDPVDREGHRRLAPYGGTRMRSHLFVPRRRSKACRPKRSASTNATTPETRSGNVIVVNSEHPGERQRFTLSHELGHLVLDLRSVSETIAEAVCNRFAGAFLVPEDTLRAELGKNRTSISIRELFSLKELLGRQRSSDRVSRRGSRHLQ
jgi:hypothetical protein